MKKIDYLCILKATEDFGTDSHPHPVLLVRGTRYGFEDPDPHPDPYKNVTDPEHCNLVPVLDRHQNGNSDPERIRTMPFDNAASKFSTFEPFQVYFNFKVQSLKKVR
jgi:hypothetical protein